MGGTPSLGRPRERRPLFGGVYVLVPIWLGAPRPAWRPDPLLSMGPAGFLGRYLVTVPNARCKTFGTNVNCKTHLFWAAHQQNVPVQNVECKVWRKRLAALAFSPNVLHARSITFACKRSNVKSGLIARWGTPGRTLYTYLYENTTEDRCRGPYTLFVHNSQHDTSRHNPRKRLYRPAAQKSDTPG